MDGLTRRIVGRISRRRAPAPAVADAAA